MPGNEIDPSDRDNGIRLRNVPVKGLCQPDTFAAYKHEGRTHLVMANEGDARDNGEEDSEDERRGSNDAGGARLVPGDGPAELFRANFSNLESAPGNLMEFGGHSFSIRDTDGRIVFDTGSQFDANVVELGIHADGRSANKGVELEGVALPEIKGRALQIGPHRPPPDGRGPSAPLPRGVTPGRSDPGSSPCSRPPRSRARTWAARRSTHRPPPGPGAASSSRTPGRRPCPST